MIRRFLSIVDSNTFKILCQLSVQVPNKDLKKLPLIPRGVALYLSYQGTSLCLVPTDPAVMILVPPTACTLAEKGCSAASKLTFRRIKQAF